MFCLEWTSHACDAHACLIPTVSQELRNEDDAASLLQRSIKAQQQREESQDLMNQKSLKDKQASVIQE